MRMLLVAALLSACANRALPTNRDVEQTYPQVTHAPVQGDLRVVTFNVHRETPEKVIEGITKDPALANADIFILQEVHRVETAATKLSPCSPACVLAKQLGYHAIYAPGHMQGDGSDGVAVVSRIPLKSAEVIELPYFNVHYNSGRRVALAVTLEHQGKPLTIYAVHLDNRINVADRAKQMLPVLEHANRHDTPVIIAGDFNTSPFTWVSGVIPVLTTTQDNNFERLVRAHGFATPVKDSGPTHHHLWMKLDGIYTRGFDTTSFATAKARDVSDHLALWATLRSVAPSTKM
jgi:endonuclease/exonuclease/phosphatase family metal-dependent hydrolase